MKVKNKNGIEQRPDAGPFGVEEVLKEELDVLRPKGADGDEPLSALCISGGGIRSATFGLGVLQGLAEFGLLSRFDYLSTVSGGGYIGSWLTAWKHRVGGIKRVARRLRATGPEKDKLGPDPIAHLREYNSYLTPKLGALSADSWTVVATVLRNLLLNWMVIVPLLMVAVLVPRLYLSLLSLPELLYGDIIHATAFPNFRHPDLDVISHSWVVSGLLPALSLGAYGYALFNMLRFMPCIGGMDHSRAEYFSKILLPVIVAVMTFIMIEALYYLGSNCHPSFEGAVDNCEGPADLMTLLLGWSLPGFAAWVAYRIWAGRNQKERRVSVRSILFAFLLMAGLGAFMLWISTYLFLPYVGWAGYVALGPPAVLAGFVLGSHLFVGFSSKQLHDDDREWMSSNMAGMLLFIIAWAALCGLVMVVPVWVLEWRSWAPHLVALLGGISGFAAAFGGGLLASPEGGDKPSRGAAIVSSLVTVSPYVFIAALLIGLSLLANYVVTQAYLLPGATLFEAQWLTFAVEKWDDPSIYGIYHEPVPWDHHDMVLERTSPGLLLGLIAGFGIIGWFSSRYININTFSLGGMYRHRLIRAYLGASNPKRQAQKFTGFADDDDIHMHDLKAMQRPFHVLNLTLNLVQSSRLAWQQRKAESFTVSPLHCGNSDLGYRSSARYGGEDGITLGTAVAISGAAASPSMGSKTTPAMGFIMTLLNARLGAWLGNPANAGTRSWQHAGPKHAIRSIVSEALGLTTNQNEYVYLSDGGHFENLGLYEMVKRRCRAIVLIDGGCDPDFSYDDLGNALRKIRIDFGVRISFDDELTQPLRDRTRRCAVGRIRYSETTEGDQDGWLIYIKPMVLGNEAPDVLNYSRRSEEFPHETTGDQWFSESQTESYRMLGLQTVEQMAHGWEGGMLEDFYHHVQRYITEDDVPGVKFKLPKDLRIDDEDPEPGAPDDDRDPPFAFKSTFDATRWPENAPGGSFDIRNMDDNSFKVRVAKWLFDNPQWWMGIFRRWWPVAKFPGGWAFISRYDHVKEALEQEAVFQVPFGERMREMMGGPNFVLGMQDGKRYQREKAQIHEAFDGFERADLDRVVTPESAALAEKVVAECGGQLDVVEALLTRVPTHICEVYYGVDIPDPIHFAQWSIAMSGYMFSPPGKRPAFAATAFAASKCFTPVLQDSIAAVRALPPEERGDTVLARFVNKQDGDPSLTDDLIRAHLSGMITGFVPTNSLAAGNALEVMLKRPDIMNACVEAALADDDERLRDCIFEAMRFKPINPGPFRAVHEDYYLGEASGSPKKVKAGTRVMVSTQSANFDDRRVKNPKAFRPGRPNEETMMMFGHALHWCIGRYIAETQITQTFKPLLKQPGLRRAKGKAGKMRRHSLFPAHLIMEFDV